METYELEWPKIIIIQLTQETLLGTHLHLYVQQYYDVHS